MKNILTGRIDYLNFEDGETVCSTRVIRATRSTVAKLYLICIYVFAFYRSWWNQLVQNLTAWHHNGTKFKNQISEKGGNTKLYLCSLLPR
jgi:hypothetical protein